jgi:hypothetical protein
VPQPEPAKRVVQGREPGGDPDAALQLGLEFGQRDVRRRLDQPAQVGFVRLEDGTAIAAVAFGCGTPVARTRCISLIAGDGLMAKRRPAARIELPPSTACTIRRRRSKEIDAGMTTSRQPILSNHSC